MRDSSLCWLGSDVGAGLIGANGTPGVVERGLEASCHLTDFGFLDDERRREGDAVADQAQDEAATPPAI
jgi:hypothetical protein